MAPVARNTNGKSLIGDMVEARRGTIFVVSGDKGVSLSAWCRANRVEIENDLRRFGAILFRGFRIDSTESFSQTVVETSAGWADYREPATPRTQVLGNIFTSTDYPARYEIALHNENSHCVSWPMKIYFFCMDPPRIGGQTLIADCRRILDRIPAKILARFEDKGWLYVRTFGKGMGFSWQKVFNARSREDVEQYCLANSMKASWENDSSLTVRYTRPALRTHPVTGERIWFNHGLFFNPISLEAELRQVLLDEGEDSLPYNTFYGDGEAVEEEVLLTIQNAYRSETVLFDWEEGDVLLADNMLFAHGRAPFEGPRRILVGMADASAPVDSW